MSVWVFMVNTTATLSNSVIKAVRRVKHLVSTVNKTQRKEYNFCVNIMLTLVLHNTISKVNCYMIVTVF